MSRIHCDAIIFAKNAQSSIISEFFAELSTKIPVYTNKRKFFEKV
jgi:hypothetical protein